MYVLLRYINEYYQEGGYFVGLYSSFDELRKQVNHFGRKDFENEWYGYIYTDKDICLKRMSESLEITDRLFDGED